MPCTGVVRRDRAAHTILYGTVLPLSTACRANRSRRGSGLSTLLSRYGCAGCRRLRSTVTLDSGGGHTHQTKSTSLPHPFEVTSHAASALLLVASANGPSLSLRCPFVVPSLSLRCPFVAQFFFHDQNATAFGRGSGSQPLSGEDSVATSFHSSSRCGLPRHVGRPPARHVTVGKCGGGADGAGHPRAHACACARAWRCARARARIGIARRDLATTPTPRRGRPLICCAAGSETSTMARTHTRCRRSLQSRRPSPRPFRGPAAAPSCSKPCTRPPRRP